MKDSDSHKIENKSLLKEVRYSLRELLAEVAEEREGSSIGQEMVDQTEIGKLFKSRKKKANRGNSGE
ncbi:hypothetical protein G0Q06_01675 [Puniceicoccales bacterium CK1056]|uniref:Uncharacterized protein n=1 Tax=Oceanipulchritudo coccoides TaxID=2706888 RepID=A0A6B2LXW8_9BACT|nr:hypothetical protein [Oceanipulchritudo coccoides]NDV61153.1 hypothetical protein [Oceanipulchritudo coccoides]